MIELSFPLRSPEPIPADHGYALFAAISSLLPIAHQQNAIAIQSIRGRQIGNGQLALQPWSQLTLRIPDTAVADYVPLAGKPLRIGPTIVRTGVPRVQLLTPAPALRSRIVVIKVAHITPPFKVTPEQFQQALRKQLDQLDVSPEVTITLPPNQHGLPRRRVLEVKHKRIVGYEVLLKGLAAEESLAVLEQGLGGKRHMGCGVFVPVGKERGAT